MTAPELAEVWIALSTAPDQDVAERLGRLAVEESHAACANVISGLRSVYRWQGQIQNEPEVLIVFKTTREAYAGLADLVARHHPYEVPELIAFPVSTGLAPYLRWVRENTVPAEQPVDRDERGV
jgi:periplasmic divalent cation tolerance protein